MMYDSVSFFFGFWRQRQISSDGGGGGRRRCGPGSAGPTTGCYFALRWSFNLFA